jgi:2-keto-4-pentenoate hydratase/2-oxohepta-3-ene-1,7-dioic acid hydratase in catechol pathway
MQAATSPTRWVRFDHRGVTSYGIIEGEMIAHVTGDPFDAPSRNGRASAVADVTLLAPCVPSKVIGLWNNFGALATKLELTAPAEPLYFFKAASALLGPGETIRVPPFYNGRVIFEAELGIVIGRRATGVDEASAAEYIFGYTCVNDVTAFDVLNADPSFAQWSRAKGYDTFAPFGPAIATGLDPDTLTIRAILNGEERQNYPASDMLIKPAAIVSALSRCMTLMPGDVIACGTSVGAGTMKPGSSIEIAIEGIGTLANTFA